MTDHAERWLHLDPAHPAIPRAFGLPDKGDGLTFALYPFRVDRIDGAWHVLAAWPCPRTIGVIDTNADGVISVISWNPVTNMVRTLGDEHPQVVGRLDVKHNGQSATLYGAALPFFRAWIAARLAYWRSVTQGARRVHGLGAEPDLIPGGLLVGRIEHIRLPLAAMAPEIECVGIHPGAVNRRIQELARLPQARAKTEQIGEAA